MSAERGQETGKRRPTTADLPMVIEAVAEGASLREACRRLGIHPGHTHAALAGDNDFWAQYARAREVRAEALGEDSLSLARAAALGMKIEGQAVDAAGARVYLEAVKWNAARMAPKTHTERQVLEHTGKDGQALPAAPPAPITFLAVYPERRRDDT